MSWQPDVNEKKARDRHPCLSKGNGNGKRLILIPRSPERSFACRHKQLEERNVLVACVRTHQLNCRGCSGAFWGIPGVAGSSNVSGSGGFGLPSILRVRAMASRAVMASRLGIFLYPTLTLLSPSELSFSSVSAVRASPPPFVALTRDGDDERLEAVAGDAERVRGGLTAIESVADAAVDDIEADEPVRRRDAARRGRED